MKTILKACSYIFHPLFVSVYTSLYFFGSNKNYYDPYVVLVILAQVTLLTILIPLAIFYLLNFFKLLDSDIMVNDVKQRRLPLAIQIIYFFIIYFHTLKPVPFSDLRYFFLGALISTILSFILAFVNKKVSLHMVGITGTAAFIIGQTIKTGYPNILLICAVILVCGLVGTSRLSLKAHTPFELFMGTIIGLYGQIVIFKYWL